jgi:L-methionine (R)-S-oxide reductase
MSVDYKALARDLKALLGEERDLLANSANTCALLFEKLPRLNWAGFYFLRGEDLVLGPFQGKPACIRIGLGNGVCGKAAQRQETLVVVDVHQFPGHIACDSASRSEIVVPLLPDGRLIGVLDLDSPERGRFTSQDREGLERLADIYVMATDFSPLLIQ